MNKLLSVLTPKRDISRPDLVDGVLQVVTVMLVAITFISGIPDGGPARTVSLITNHASR